MLGSRRSPRCINSSNEPIDEDNLHLNDDITIPVIGNHPFGNHPLVSSGNFKNFAKL